MGQDKHLGMEFNLDGNNNNNNGDAIEPRQLTDRKKGSNLKCWIFGIFFLTMSIVTLIVSPNTKYIRKKMILTDEEMLNLWMTPNVEVFAKFHFFNITNKVGFLEGSEKLKMQEVGPFIYRIKNSYQNPVFNDKNGTVTIKPELAVEWDPKLNNNRSEEDILTLVNAVMLVTLNKQYDPFGVIEATINQMIRQMRREPIEDQSIKTFLFGERSYLIEFLSTVILGMKFDRFGVLTAVLDYTDESHTFFTGTHYYENAGLFANINNEMHLPYYKAPCNRLAGASDGKKFGNNIDPKQKLYLFTKIFCRTATIVPSGPPTISSQGIPVIPYTLSDEFIDNGQVNPDNKCFCVNNKCLPYGLMDVSNCFMGFPVALSLPHFYKGDPSLMHNLEGLYPNASLHSSKLFLNLETGVATSFSLKVQANLFVGDQCGTKFCSKFSNMTIPIAWAEAEFLELEPLIAFRIYLTLRIFPIAEKLFAALTFVTGLYFIFIEVFLKDKIIYYKKLFKLSKNKTAKTRRDYARRENTSLNDVADKQLKTLLSNDDSKSSVVR